MEPTTIDHAAMGAVPAEGTALLATLGLVAPSAPTACAGWSAHDVVAHLGAGAKEIADLIEEKLAGEQARPTRDFEVREAPFRALSHDELLARLVDENIRKLAAYAALATTDDPTITFTGTRISVAELQMHSRSEASIHRWDLVGDDDISDELLAQPELTGHAVMVLNRMPSLNESARALGARTSTIDAAPVRVIFRSPARDDVVFSAGPEGARFEQTGQPAEGDVMVTTDPANRLLVLWGRRSSERKLSTDGDPGILEVLDSAFWPNARPGRA